MFEDPELDRQSGLPGRRTLRRSEQEDKYNNKLPEVHDVLQELRKVANEYNAVLIGETWTRTSPS